MQVLSPVLSINEYAPQHGKGAIRLTCLLDEQATQTVANEYDGAPCGLTGHEIRRQGGSESVRTAVSYRKAFKAANRSLAKSPTEALEVLSATCVSYP